VKVSTIRLVTDAGIDLAITDVGYGISQILPIIVQSVMAKGKSILIEQPELHLHPAQQAELGDLFINAALGEQENAFLIETHSEHLLLRLMRRMRETVNGNLPEGIPPVSPDDVSILYVQPTPKGSIVRILELDAEGQLLDPWPGGFFEEGFRERFA
jgi:predicted ATPase